VDENDLGKIFAVPFKADVTWFCVCADNYVVFNTGGPYTVWQI